MKQEIETKPRIYVGCLAAYNNGQLHGEWIDADQDAETIMEAIQTMLAGSPIAAAEDWAIHDHKGFEGVEIGEYESIERVAQIAVFVGEHGKLGAKLISYFNDIEEARSAMEDKYAGEYRSLADFAQELTEQIVTIPESVLRYVDYKRMGRDLEINDVTVFEIGFEQIHVFWN